MYQLTPTMTDELRKRARALAHSAIAEGMPTAWFEQLYAEAREGQAVVPWDDRAGNPLLIRWLDQQMALETGLPETIEPKDPPDRGEALDVGCGFGDNTIVLLRRGFSVQAIDIAASALPVAQDRVAHQVPALAERAHFRQANVLELPVEFHRRFAFVLEVYTLQVLPPKERMVAARAIANAVAPGGVLLLIARAREEDEHEGLMPWPLIASEIHAIADDTLKLQSLEQVIDNEEPPVRRFVAVFHRSA